MHQQSDPGEPERLDAIVLAAFGERLSPADADHQSGCLECMQERVSLAGIVTLARNPIEPLGTPDVRPPASVWAGIAAELGLDLNPAQSAAVPVESAAEAVPVATPDSPTPIPRSAHRVPLKRSHRWLLASVAAVALIGAACGGYLLGHSRTPTKAVAVCATNEAALAQMPDAPAGASGQAAVACSTSGPSLRVTTSKLPLREGFYEVWLYAPTSGKMVAVGTLGTNGSGAFTLPAGVDLREFHVVDVSAQLYNGNPAHAQSVLRGPLTS
ncbi:anti-sigma-K factor rskA [Jatrophihabitans sp. GAS493]|uniref:anti-sigma factor n=1 Tax=Jatrophihabitans sp. GAS493 TaxID=1907575 RepID=UPI000BB93AD3|nr:anti-sigma factor [Jatrophihabitans sp. GAS493]SOD72308.1 anti-sigma-K factor rskA [Jatrophihabitans sp. GAS493]